MRVGNVNEAFSTSNSEVMTGIVDGGIFSLTPQAGRYLTIRRDGYDPGWGAAGFGLKQIKVYECPNLL